MSTKIIGALSALFISIIVFMSCSKDSETTTPTCDVKGTYTGTSMASTGASGTLTYTLQDNNFAVGRITPTGPAVTFGGYRGSCDSVILSVYYTSGSSYYLLKGKLVGNVISGTFNNLTTPSDYGTFSITK